jgi:hypothetical protein
MKIKRSGQTHVLYRYAGQVEGKTLETKVGILAVGTKPTEIPPEVLENLTPKEAREVADLLHREQLELTRGALTRLHDALESAAVSITEETLDSSTAERLSKMLMRCKAAISRVQRNRQPEADRAEVQPDVLLE